MSQRILVIGNKNYSSWSLRGWLAVRMAGLEFEEKRVLLSKPDTAEQIQPWSPSGLVPVLLDGDVVVHDSLAIAEYVNERYAHGSMYPENYQRRAQCRSVCAEMHSGFAAIRQSWPMDLSRKPAPPASLPVPKEVLERELERVMTLWEDLLAHSEDQGPFLFGAPTIADAMYLPLATRLITYEVPMNKYPRCALYVEQLLGWELYLPWKKAALAETERI
ncbi:MAG: glutathione S-transferase family protein [Deltaproteobacteria bacterium]|nr:glutathione S-transferase family protein [Deltaproteobacteria bacterium]